MASPSLLLGLLFIPLFLLLLSIRRVSLSNRRRLPPSPPKLPLIGNLHQLGFLPHQSLTILAKNHGPLMLLQLGQVPTLIVSSAEMVREIVKTWDVVFSSRPSLKTADVLLYGSRDVAFAPYGEDWRQTRKICITHLLSMRRVHSYQVAREEEVAHLIEKISQVSSSSLVPVNMSELLYFFANNMLCRVILGKSSREEGRNKMFREMIEEASALLGGFRVEDYFPRFGWLSSFTGLHEKAKRNSTKWDSVLDKMIGEHENRMEEKQEEYNFLDILLSLEKDPNMDFLLTKESIKAILMDMFAAGTDTSYITLEWALAELVRNPQVMKQLQNEIRSVAYGKLRVEEMDLSGMNYMKAVIKETLRLHPPAPLLLPHESTERCTIEGYEIPAQTTVIINYWAIGRDTKYWEAPEEFRPERFLSSPIDFKGQDYQYTPFGSGRRSCPGINLALFNIELALVNLVHRFDWELPHGITGKDLEMTEAPGLTMRMKNNLYLIPKPCC